MNEHPDWLKEHPDWIDAGGSLNLDVLTPTEYLLIESLISRHRLGEHEWSYPNKTLPTINRLEARGVVTSRSHVMEGWVYVRASDLLLSILKPYKPPIIRDMLGEYGEDDPPWAEYGALTAIIADAKEESAANGEDWWKDPPTLADRIMKTGRVIVLPSIVRRTKQ